MISTRNQSFVEVGKFGMVGVLNTIIDFTILNLLIYYFGTPENKNYFTLFKAISFLAAVVNSYVLNKYWVFVKNEKSFKFHEGILFLVVSTVGLLINIGVSTIIFNFVKNSFELSHHISANVGACIGSLSVLVWNYFGYKLVVFKK